MGARTGFFSPIKQMGENNTVINAGGGQFQATAVALIDYLQSNSQVNDATLKKILGRFYQYFPQYVNNEHLTTPKERMARLLNNSRKSELVECMAYVLRQLAVDELYADHLNLNYRKIFANVTAETSKGHLRDPKVALHKSALIALEQTLGLPIILSFKEPGKELRKLEKRTEYGQSALVLQIQEEDKYYPTVKRKADFTYVGQLAVSAKPEVIPAEQEGTMADMLAAIQSDNQELLHAYEQQRHTILSMVKAGEITHQQLRDHYIALFPLLPHKASYIMRLEHAIHPIIAGVSLDSEQRTVDLANTLASWIAANVIKEDQLFDRIENTQLSVLAR
jgi:hypothetical protein